MDGSPEKKFVNVNNHKLIKMNNFFLTIAFLSFLTTSHYILAQATITISTECGKAVESEFTNINESQDFKVRMAAGDRLELNIIPLGNYLKVRASILDPGNGNIYTNPNGTWYPDQKSLVIKTDVLSASGIYTIRVSNFPLKSFVKGTVGTYTVYVKCYKRDGSIIEPK
jgi:hypothetical protein